MADDWDIIKDMCPDCSGNGSRLVIEPDGSMKTENCGRCHGTGWLRTP